MTIRDSSGDLQLTCDNCWDDLNIFSGEDAEVIWARAAKVGWTKLPHPEIELDYCPRCG